MYRMRKYKNNIVLRLGNIIFNIRNITFSLQNIISFYRNITSHFTGKEKIITLRFRNITLASIIIMLSFTNITLCFSNTFNNSNVSASDYSSNVGIGFTFNPTLSISLNSNDLVIPNLVPGSIEDSNSINVSVATNAAYGYTLSANVNNKNLVHDNNTNTFSSIATNASLETLTTDNTWGYSYKLSNDSNIWSNYSGLSTDATKTIVNTDNQTSKPIDFKIAAKASPTQPSGIYTGTINFYAITKPTPMNLAESYFAHGKSRYKGYYTMQDMTTEICNDTEIIGEGSQTELIDIRDNKVYWATKLADNHCWMTQNLDLDLDSNRTYTHWDTDLGWSTDNGGSVDEDATWKPSHSTINFDGANTNQVVGWVNSTTEPYSANPGDIYYYTSGTEDSDIKYNSLQKCISAGNNDCIHYHAGNYYNWSAAVGSNDTSSLTIQYDNSPYSICPKSWRLPKRNQITKKLDYAILTDAYKADAISIRNGPLYFVRSGVVRGSITDDALNGFYYHGTIYNDVGSYFMSLSGTFIRPNEFGGSYYGRRFNGYPVRCLAR